MGCKLILILSALIAFGTGCISKTRSVDMSGMYVTDSGTLAIGSIEVMSAPHGEETAAIRYSEDTAWLSPSTKIHEVKILLTGTNSVTNATVIVRDICRAFMSVSCQTNRVENK